MLNMNTKKIINLSKVTSKIIKQKGRDQQI